LGFFLPKKPPWVGDFGTVIKNFKLFCFRNDFKVFTRKIFELVHTEPALKKIYFEELDQK
jgi:hypothetical protein